MRNKIHDISTYRVKSTDRLFFDCNAFMYIFYTAGSYTTNDIDNYKGIFQNALRSNASIYVPSIFVSEFINTYIRSEYRRYLRINHFSQRNFDFKHNYKNTQDYKDVIGDVKNIVNNQILKTCIKADDLFSKIDLSDLFGDEATFDFNDRYYGKISELNNFKIVTNDADFSSISDRVEIITSNSALLQHTNNNTNSEEL